MRLLAVLSSLLGLLLATGGAAQAGPGGPAYVYRDLYLTANPVDSMATACTSRRIAIAAGTYTWVEAIGTTSGFNNTWGRAARSIYLGSGNYSWNVCLDPKNGAYVETSTLNPDNPAWSSATLTSVPTVVGSSGTWRMWSSLD
jgi:hypothetical protein